MLGCLNDTICLFVGIGLQNSKDLSRIKHVVIVLYPIRSSMPYRYIDSSCSGTFQEIASVSRIPFTKGCGYYALTRKEKISAGKSLLLYSNGSLISSIASDVRKLCGVGDGAINVSGKDIPDKYTLFVQSTSNNRKIADGEPVVFYVDNEESSVDGDSEEDDVPETKRAKLGTTIDFESLLNLPQELDDNCFSDMITKPIGALFNGVDEPIPLEMQEKDLLKICALGGATWNSVTVNNITSLSCIGQYKSSQARIEYRVLSNAAYVAMVLGTWGCILGEYECHPFIYSYNICYDNSDGSFDMPRLPDVDSLNALDCVLGFSLRLYQIIARDNNH